MKCGHYTLSKVVDRLGMMREQPDGSVTAPVLEYHYECLACHQELYRTNVEPPVDSFTEAMDKIAVAGQAIRHVRALWTQQPTKEET